MYHCARLLLLIMLGTTWSSFLTAQADVSELPEPQTQVYVFISPLKTIDLVNPGLLYGAGLKWPAGYAVEFGHLYLFENIPRAPRVMENRGNRYHLSLRKYFKPEEPADVPAPYLQLRTDYLRRHHRAVSTFAPLRDTSEGIDPPDYPDSIGVHTTTLTFNGMLGFEYPFGRFIVDLSAGLGWRWRRVRHTDRIREEDTYSPYYHAEEFFTRNDPGEETTFNIPFDLRLIYRF